MRFETYAILCVILCATFVMGFIIAGHKEMYVLAVGLKTVASVCFVMLGFLCAGAGLEGEAGAGSIMDFVTGTIGLLDSASFTGCVLYGLLFGMGGDLLMGLRHIQSPRTKAYFLSGILVFMLGHVTYLIALLREISRPWLSATVGLVISIGVMGWMKKRISATGVFQVFGMIYIAAVTTMALVAVWDSFALGGKGYIMLGLGAVAFQISDMILIYNNFSGKKSFGRRIANLVLYYGGQLLIAGSLLFF